MFADVAGEELSFDAAKVLVSGIVVGAIELDGDGGESAIAIGVPPGAIDHGDHVDPLGGSGHGGIAIDLGDGILVAKDNDLFGGKEATQVVALDGAKFPALQVSSLGGVAIDGPDPVGGETPDGVGETGDLVARNPPVGRASQAIEEEGFVEEIKASVRIVGVEEKTKEGVVIGDGFKALVGEEREKGFPS